jgi:hypothetical protein
VLLVSATPHRAGSLVVLAPSDSEIDASHAHVVLVAKDAEFHEVAGARGRVDYVPAGSTLAFQLRAWGLDPNVRYLIELDVDTTIYAVASRAADQTGALALDTTLTRFAEGVCVGPNYDQPRALSGRHTIKFWVKRDGNPKSGTSRDARRPESASLPCAGNGDGDYRYALLERQPAIFTGTP